MLARAKSPEELCAKMLDALGVTLDVQGGGGVHVTCGEPLHAKADEAAKDHAERERGSEEVGP